jgi:hypothetical protein
LLKKTTTFSRVRAELKNRTYALFLVVVVLPVYGGTMEKGTAFPSNGTFTADFGHPTEIES